MPKVVSTFIVLFLITIFLGAVTNFLDGLSKKVILIAYHFLALISALMFSYLDSLDWR